MEFNDWLERQLLDRGMRPQDLANAGDIDPATVSAIRNERREVGPDVARRVAKALALPQWVVFRAAGLLTEDPAYQDKPMSPVLASIMHDLERCPDEDALKMLHGIIRQVIEDASRRVDKKAKA